VHPFLISFQILTGGEQKKNKEKKKEEEHVPEKFDVESVPQLLCSAVTVEVIDLEEPKKKTIKTEVKHSKEEKRAPAKTNNEENGGWFELQKELENA
jgi:hypothetical protein